jgi:hypothetical protein
LRHTLMNCWLNTLKLKVVSSILHTCVHQHISTAIAGSHEQAK